MLIPQGKPVQLVFRGYLYFTWSEGANHYNHLRSMLGNANPTIRGNQWPSISENRVAQHFQKPGHNASHIKFEVASFIYSHAPLPTARTESKSEGKLRNYRSIDSRAIGHLDWTFWTNYLLPARDLPQLIFIYTQFLVEIKNKQILFMVLVILKTQSTVCEMILSFTRHFDRRTIGPSPDILIFRRTFYVHQKRELSQDILNIRTEKCNFFARHFAQFPLPGHFVRREFTPSRISHTLKTTICFAEIFPKKQ